VKYLPYPDYKPIGVEWLGGIPEHWASKRLKYIVEISNEKVDADEDDPLPYIGMEHIESWTGKLRPLDDSLVPTGISNRFESGSTLFGKLRPYLAKACNVDFGGLCSSELIVLRGWNQNQRYLLYRLLSEGFISLVNSSTYGAKMPRASWDFIGNCRLPVPPPDEQQTIADFLDARTSKIDILIAKKRELIERLSEKRTALISRTVTHGLPPEAAAAAGFEPNPKLKPSGIDWLGDVPEHWGVVPLGFLINTKSGGTPDKTNSEYWGGNIPWVSPKDMKRPFIRKTQDYVTDDALDHTNLGLLATNSVLIVVRGMILAHTFPVAINIVPVTINQDMKALLPKGLLTPQFLFWALLGFAKAIVSFTEESAHGTRKLQTDVLKRISFPVPSFTEQKYIADFLDTQTAKIDNMNEKVNEVAKKLQEYRTALITSAVTGKIDVRNFAADRNPATISMPQATVPA
jgi:type I restriction enzyme S subunit